MPPMTIDRAPRHAHGHATHRELARPAPAPRSHSASGQIRAGRLAGLSMSRAITVLAWPILCESVLNSTVGLVDTMLASGIGKDAADGVAAAAYIMWFLGLITTAIGVGASALIARSLGAGWRAAAGAALGQAVMLAGVLGTCLALALLLGAPMLASLFSLSPAGSASFIVYLRCWALGVPLATVMFAGIACARGAGDTLRPLMAMVVVNIVNLIVAWLLAGHDLAVASMHDGEVVRTVLLRHPLPERWHLDAMGIGLGTALAQSVGGLLVLGFHLRGRSGITLRARRLRPHWITISRLLRLGLPNFFEAFGMWTGNMLVVLLVSLLNASHAAADGLEAGARSIAESAPQAGGYLGAHLVAIRIEAFSFLPGFSMGIAASALVGQYLGAGNPTLAKRAAWRCALIAASLMGSLGLVFIFLGQQIVGLVSQQPEHLQISPRLLLITGLVQIPFAIGIVIRSALHGAGDVRAVMVMTWISTWGLRLPLAYVFSGVDVPLPAVVGGGIITNPFPFHYGLPGIWIGLCVELVLRGVMYSARFVQGGWLRARV